MKLSQVANIQIGILKSRFKYDSNGKYRYHFIEYANLLNDKIIFHSNRNILCINELLPDNALIKENDIIVKLYPPYSFHLIKKEMNNYVVFSNIAIIQPKTIDYEILFFILKKHFSLIQKLADGSTVKQLSLSMLKNIDINIDEPINVIKQKIDLSALFDKQKELINKKSNIINQQKKFYIEIRK